MLRLDDKQFFREMNNIMEYSVGYLDGIHQGKQKFLGSIGSSVIETLKTYIDSSARVDPQMLHHVYEWNQTGSPSARLFDIEYTISNLGLSFKSSFTQSSSVKDGSTTPFYNKAMIMENGIPVTIKPKNASILSFNVDGEQVFTKGPIEVSNPGGDMVQGSFENVFDEFFNRYFTQAFLSSSGISSYLKSPVLYKKNLVAGKSLGKSAGVSTGYRWIANAGVVI
jgi:hypothetical protein